MDEEKYYVKKPIPVRAFQMTKEVQLGRAEQWPKWIQNAWNKKDNDIGAIYPNVTSDHGRLNIRTLEGEQLISYGDYVIQGVRGELYPCKSDIFEETYNEVDKPQKIEEKPKLPEKLYVVRLYDGFDNQWMNVSKAVTKEEADCIWNEKTRNGTYKTKYADIDYFKIFPADTEMIFSNGFGEH